MEWAFDLWSFQDVRDNAEAILERLESGAMPCDGAWPEEQVEKVRRWMSDGMQPCRAAGWRRSSRWRSCRPAAAWPVAGCGCTARGRARAPVAPSCLSPVGF